MQGYRVKPRKVCSRHVQHRLGWHIDPCGQTDTHAGSVIFIQSTPEEAGQQRWLCHVVSRSRLCPTTLAWPQLWRTGPTRHPGLLHQGLTHWLVPLLCLPPLPASLPPTLHSAFSTDLLHGHICEGKGYLAPYCSSVYCTNEGPSCACQ